MLSCICEMDTKRGTTVFILLFSCQFFWNKCFNSIQMKYFNFVIIFLLDGAQEKLETVDTFTPCILETMSEELTEPLPKEVLKKLALSSFNKS